MSQHELAQLMQAKFEDQRTQNGIAFDSIDLDGSVDQLCRVLETGVQRPVLDRTGYQGDLRMSIRRNGVDRDRFFEKIKADYGLAITLAKAEVQPLMVSSEAPKLTRGRLVVPTLCALEGQFRGRRSVLRAILERLRTSIRNLPALVAVLTLTTGCASKVNTSQLTSVQIGTDIQLGATPSQVVAVLDSRHVEHTRCSVDPSKGCTLTAVSRDRSSWHLIRVDHLVEFCFDRSDRLVAKIAYLGTLRERRG